MRSTGRSYKCVLITLALCWLAAGVVDPPAVGVVRCASFFRARRGVRVLNDPRAPAWDATAQPTLRVISWNIQYGAGIEQHFFYDGGRAVSTDPASVRQTTEEIGQVLRSLDADVILLQERRRRERRLQVTHFRCPCF